MSVFVACRRIAVALLSHAIASRRAAVTCPSIASIVFLWRAVAPTKILVGREFPGMVFINSKKTHPIMRDVYRSLYQYPQYTTPCRRDSRTLEPHRLYGQ